MDFEVWAMPETEARKVQNNPILSLKKALVYAWSAVPQEHLRASCKAFKKIIEAFVKSEPYLAD